MFTSEETNGHNRTNGTNDINGTIDTNRSNGHSEVRDLDVLIIGAGFGGCYSLHKLRKEGYKCHLFEAGTAIGGVWYWNRYPGARVDSEIPYYQFSVPEVWRKWSFKERFPGGPELREYFDYVDEKLELSKDITFSANVVDADWDELTSRWTVKTEAGHVATCQHLICATGSSFKAHYPDFKGLSKFKGQLIHSTRWPEVAETKDKRVAIIGSGATAVQCTQEISKEASHLTVYIRTASISLPMFQRHLTEMEQRVAKSTYKRMFSSCRHTGSGLGYDMQKGSIFDISDEEREELWEELWNRGGFNFPQSNYRDYLMDEEANKLMYEFWAKKTRPRIKNPEKRAFLIPEKAPFAFGTKRSSLEQDYYECLDRDNVDVEDLKGNPIREFTEKGIISEDGTEREFDTVVMATGFDAMTGSLTGMNITGTDGLTFKQRWKEGVFTHLGLCSSGCPNLYMIYGPQGTCCFHPLQAVQENIC